MRHILATLLVLSSLMLGGCGYNTMQAQDEAINAAWSEVLNQYQRRADLVPNLVNVVKGYAAHEAGVLTAVTNARAGVGSVKADASLLNDEAAFNKFQAAQGEMSSALSRLLVVELPDPQGRRQLPRPAGPTGRHGKPYHRGPQPLHQGCAGLQHHRALVPVQLYGHGL